MQAIPSLSRLGRVGPTRERPAGRDSTISQGWEHCPQLLTEKKVVSTAIAARCGPAKAGLRCPNSSPLLVSPLTYRRPLSMTQSSPAPATLLARARRTWDFSLSLASADFLLAGMVITLGAQFWLERTLDPGTLAVLAGLAVAGQALTLA